MNINVNDFDLFETTIKALVKIVNQAKFVLNGAGLTIYSMNSFARTEITTNCISSEEACEFCINDVSLIQKILMTLRREFDKTKIDLKIKFDGQFVHFISSKMKAKVITVREDIIRDYVSLRKVQTQLMPVFEFQTTSSIIKNIAANTYIFPDPTMARIYLKTSEDGMDKNSIYALIDNKNNTYSNSMLLKLGIIKFGNLNREIIVDVDRLMLFNILDSNEINITLMDKNVLVSEVIKISDDSKTKLEIKIYNSIRKN